MTVSENPESVEEPRATGQDLDRQEGQRVGYTSRLFVQALFPYRKQQHNTIKAQNRELTITLVSPNGLPYGKYPRLMMAYIMTEAVKRSAMPDQDEARRIPLGSSLNEFMQTMGLRGRGTGGSRGTVTLIREQLRRLTTTVVMVESVTSVSPDLSRSMGRNLPVVDSWDLWFHRSADQLALEESYIELSRDFYSFLLEYPVPLDLDMLRALEQPRAMDLYIWLTYRKFPLQGRTARPAVYSWRELHTTFGPDTATDTEGRKNFKKRLRSALDEVQQVWPEVGASLDSDGLTLQPGEPSVPRRLARRHELRDK